MEPYEYATMAKFEDFYWWYRGLHGMIADLLLGAGIGAQARVLDAGCGTGGNMQHLRQTLSVEPYGFDYSSDASPFWGNRSLRRCGIASINEIPYPSDSFDAVVSVDVLESNAVNEQKAISELVRVTRPGGVLLLVVPAYRWLLTEEHHRAVHASRRYTRAQVIGLLQAYAVEIIRATYFFTLLFPAIALYRLALQRFSQPPSETPRSELNPLPSLINSALTGLMQAERKLAQVTDLPFGSSVIVLGRKRAP